MFRRVIAVLAGYLVFAVPAALLFALTRQDPLLAPSVEFAVVSTVYGMAFAFLGGWIAAKFGGTGEMRNSVLVGIVILLIAVISLLVQIGKGSIWSQLATIVLIAPSAVVGGWVRHRSVRARDKSASHPDQ